MSMISNVLLYVADPEASAGFYTRLLGRDPVEAGPAFVMFAQDSGFALGLWRKDTVQPEPAALAGAAEVGIKVAEPSEVDALHDAWKAKGAAIALAPTDMGFGRSFVALDPDGHRLRVYALSGEM